MRRFAAALALTATLCAWSVQSSAQNLRIIPGGSPSPTATPTPSGVLLRFSGQLLDVDRGYVFFTTGDGFRLAPNAPIVDATTNQPVAQPPTPRMYATATFDGGTGRITQLAVSKNPIAKAAQYGTPQAYADIQHFAVQQSELTPNTDQRPNAYKGPPMTGKSVAVTFVVQVPPDTPLTDSVYITTDVSDWDPRAILMTRIDALHYRATTTFRSGTTFHYKYTRGSFRSIEVGRNGLNDPPHMFIVREADALRRDDVVYHWMDESVGTGTQNIGPGSVPTPFNPSAVLNRPTPPSAFFPQTGPSLPPGIGPAPPGGVRNTHSK